MVKYTETSTEGREFQGTISNIEIIEAEGKFPEQYKITIKPVSENAKDWKDQTIYISIPNTASSTNVPKKSFLGFMCKALETMGLVAETHRELIQGTKGKTFNFKDLTPKVDGEIITKKDKLVWMSLIE